MKKMSDLTTERYRISYTPVVWFQEIETEKAKNCCVSFSRKFVEICENVTELKIGTWELIPFPSYPELLEKVSSLTSRATWLKYARRWQLRCWSISECAWTWSFRKHWSMPFSYGILPRGYVLNFSQTIQVGINDGANRPPAFLNPVARQQKNE